MAAAAAAPLWAAAALAHPAVPWEGGCVAGRRQRLRGLLWVLWKTRVLQGLPPAAL